MPDSSFTRDALGPHSPGARVGTRPLSETGMATPADYFELLKPRVMSLVIFTGLVGLVVAPGTINPVIGFVALLCIAIGAGASGALNMWYDADIDARMKRTVSRPVPAGRVTPGEAFGFGLKIGRASCRESVCQYG